MRCLFKLWDVLFKDVEQFRYSDTVVKEVVHEHSTSTEKKREVFYGHFFLHQKDFVVVDNSFEKSKKLASKMK